MSGIECGVKCWCRRGRTGLLVVALLAVFAGLVSAQQTGRISGRVTDGTSGAPLSDVQVYLVGANIGGITRQTGQYLMINVPAGSYELRAERIGLTTISRQITLAAGATLEENFQMAAQALGLDEIVVTGTAGAARRREVGNQVAQINTVDLPDRPTSVMDMLTAMAPGVEVNPVGGGETGQGSEIVIRGINSINNNRSPVIFIDGVRIMSNNFDQISSPDYRSGRGANNEPSPLAQLNPNDIERIEIISGPAASTLYGTDASAGVIQVFTRRGAARAPQWTAELQQGTMWNQQFGANGVDYLWMDPWICTGPFKCGQYQHIARTQNYTLSVRGGAEALQYFVSGGFQGELGATPNDMLDRWNVRGNFTISPFEDVVFQWNTSYTNTWQKNTPTGNNSNGLTLNVFRQNQNYFGTGDVEVLNQTLDWDIQQTIERFTTGGTITYSPLSNLTNRLTIGYDYSQQETRNLRPFGFIVWPQGGLDVQIVSRKFLSFDYVGTYTFNLAESLRSSFSWGGQAIGDMSSNVEAWGEGFPGAAIPTVNSASTTLGFEEREKVWNSGFFLQNVFDLTNKYFLTVGMRVDGNSTFGKGFGLQMYPKASLAWVVSDESFWRPGFGEMKLRAAWGKSGRAPDALIAQRTWNNTGLEGNPAFTPGNLGNPDIGPEVTSELELGFDAAWLNDRIRPQFTYYHQTTKDAIQSVSTIPSLGFTSNVNFNIGEVQNYGAELALDVTAIRRANWGLDLSTSFSKNGSNVVKWAGETDPSSSTRIGRPISYQTWTMYENSLGMGTSRGTTGTYSPQSCMIQQDDPNTPQVDSVPRPGVDPSIHSCSFNSSTVYGYPLSRPNTLANLNTTLRMPFGISLSARADFRGGPGYWRSTNPIAIGRNVRSPVCFPYYQNENDVLLRVDTPALWVLRCSGNGSGYNHKGDEFKLRSVTATIPMDFAFPDRVQSAALTLVLENALTLNHSLWHNYAGGQERLPPTTNLRASLRVTF
jgi:outer membrane receptor protein involved in Fe transport